MSSASYRRSSKVLLLAALVGVAGTAALGLWQLSRAHQKQLLYDQRLSREQLPALENVKLPCAEDAWKDQEQRSAWLTGRWLPEQTLFLDNRMMKGRVGLLVLTPFELHPAPGGSGCQGQHVLLVQRGWLPQAPQDRQKLPEVRTPAGDIRLQVRLTFAPSERMALAHEVKAESGQLRQNVNLTALEHQWAVKLLPGSAQQLQAVATDPLDDRFLREWWRPEPEMVRHQAYAFQWFLMALGIAMMYVWYQWWRPAVQRVDGDTR